MSDYRRAAQNTARRALAAQAGHRPPGARTLSGVDVFPAANASAAETNREMGIVVAVLAGFTTAALLLHRTIKGGR